MTDKIEIFNDNADFFERFSNSENETTTDRFGRVRKTITGLEKEVEAIVSLPENINVVQGLGESKKDVVSQDGVTKEFSKKANITSPNFTGTPTALTIPMDWSNVLSVSNVTSVTNISRTSVFIGVAGKGGNIDLSLSESRRPAIHFTGSISEDVTINFNTVATTTYNYTLRNATVGSGKLFIKYKNGSSSLEIPKGKTISYISNGTAFFPVSDFSGDISTLTGVVNNGLIEVNERIDNISTDNREFTSFTGLLEEVPARSIVSSITKNRTYGFNVGSSALEITDDDGKTWVNIHNFAGAQSDAVISLSNGELLVTTSNANGAYVWVSSGFGTDNLTFTKAMEAHSKFVKFPQAWSIFEYNNMILLIDYGAKAGMQYGSTDKVPYGENARYAYCSLDHGKTWKTIFDLNDWIISNGYGIEDEGVIQAKGVHCHGIAFDKWWDRTWITFGDNAYNIGGTIYSDDLGETWQWANKGKDSQSASASNSRHQNVGIKPMPNCILFGTDSNPNGVHRINRSEGKKDTGEYKIDVAYQYSNDLVLTHLCQDIYQAEHLPNSPVFFAFGAEGASVKSFLVATYDGYTFDLVWESDNNMARGYGLRSVVAPTLRGNLIMKMIDFIDGGTKTFKISGKSPTYSEEYIYGGLL